MDHGSTTVRRRLVAPYSAITDHDALRSLLGLLANHATQVDEITLYRPAGTSLLDAAENPREIDCEIRPGTMLQLLIR
jgi:predicted acetyltransferase